MQHTAKLFLRTVVLLSLLVLLPCLSFTGCAQETALKPDPAATDSPPAMALPVEVVPIGGVGEVTGAGEVTGVAGGSEGSSTATAPPASTVRLIFTGDIMVHQAQLDQARLPGSAPSGSKDAKAAENAVYDFTPQVRHVKHLLQGDAVIGNLETVLGGKERKYTGYPLFNSPDSLVDALTEVGFTTFLLSNNHTLDRKAEGASRTWATLRDRGFSVTGSFPHPAMTERGVPEELQTAPLLLNVRGMLVGILNYTYGSNMPLPPADALTLNVIDHDRIGADIDQLRASGAELIVATFHWGNEYQPKPSPQQRKTAEFCLSRGVDMIVGTHPHILQPLDILEENGKVRLVAWSLGNFISSQRTHPRERTAVLAVDLYRPAPGARPEIQRVSVAPVWMERLHPGYIAVPALPAPDDGFPTPASQRLAVHKDVLKTLGAEAEADAAGFHTVYPRKPDPQE